MGVWGWDVIANWAELRGTVAAPPKLAGDGDWCFHVKPDPGYEGLLRNPDNKVNHDGLIECEVEPPEQVGGMDAESTPVMNKFIGGIVGKHVVVTGTWVRDRSHSYKGEDIGVFDDGDNGKTEIHPVVLLLVHHTPVDARTKDLEVFVFSDDSGNVPAHVPHSDENRAGSFEVPVAPGSTFSITDEIDASGGKNIAIVKGSSGWVLRGTIHSGRASKGKGFYHARIKVHPVLEVSAVSRSADKLDLFTAGNHGTIDTAAWQPTFKDGWRGWWHVAGGLAATGSPVSGVSRSPDKLDIYVTGTDGGAYTAAWQPGDKSWRGWGRIGSISFPQGSLISSVSRSKDKVDIFGTQVDGRVRTTSWAAGDKAWKQWTHLAGGLAAPGAPVACVSRNTDHLDVMVVGEDGAIWTAAWHPGDTAWRGWWRVGTGVNLPPRGRISVIRRGVDKLVAFVCGSDGGIYTAKWSKGDKHWAGWWRIGTLQAPPGCLVSAVSRSEGMMDIFVTAEDGAIYTAAWQPAEAKWHNWAPVAGGRSAPGAPVHAVSRNKDLLDVFVAGTDGIVWTAAWAPDGKGWRGWWKVRP